MQMRQARAYQGPPGRAAFNIATPLRNHLAGKRASRGYDLTRRFTKQLRGHCGCLRASAISDLMRVSGIDPMREVSFNSGCGAISSTVSNSELICVRFAKPQQSKSVGQECIATLASHLQQNRLFWCLL